MTRQPTDGAQPRANGNLAMVQRANRDRTVEKIEAAMAAIDQEASVTGKYPQNGRLTRKELCKRAGLGESTLKNPTHQSTKSRVDQWLRKFKAAPAGLPKQADTAPYSGRGDSDRAIAAIANQLHRCKIEIEETRRKLKHAEKYSAELSNILRRNGWS